MNRSTPWQSPSVTTPTGAPSSTTTTTPCARLASSDSASPTVEVGAERDRGVEDRVPRLDPGDDLADDVDRDVLREDGEAAAAGDRLGHPPAGDRGHVGDDERDRRADPVRRGQVDVEPGADVGTVGHHEDVGVGQVVVGTRSPRKRMAAIVPRGSGGPAVAR